MSVELYVNIYLLKRKNFQLPGIYIYVGIYLGTNKNKQTNQKKQLKNNKKMIITKAKKKKNKNVNKSFKRISMIKPWHPGSIKKSVFLIKHLMLGSSMFA